MAAFWDVMWGSSVGLGVRIVGLDFSVSAGLVLVVILLGLLMSRSKVGIGLLLTLGGAAVAVPLSLVLLGALLTVLNVVFVLPTQWAHELAGVWLVAVLWLLNLGGPAVSGLAVLHNQKIARNPLRAALADPTIELRSDRRPYHRPHE